MTKTVLGREFLETYAVWNRGCFYDKLPRALGWNISIAEQLQVSERDTGGRLTFRSISISMRERLIATIYTPLQGGR